MEMIENYLDQVLKVHGVYVLQVDDEFTDEDKHQFWELWQSINGDMLPLFITQKSYSFAFVDRYSFHVALMMVREGHKVTRDKWVKEVYPTTQTSMTYITPMARTKSAYIALDEKGQLVKVNHRKMKKTNLYTVTLEDMDATDWVIRPE